jgi:hypothetical protein
VQRNEVVGDGDDVVGAGGGGEVVARREAGAALVGPDAAGGHGASLPDGGDSALQQGGLAAM